LRSATPEDDEHLLDVYASTRSEELEQVAWDEARKVAFVRMQFAAQDLHYRQHFADAAFDVVVVDGLPAGRLTVARWPDEIRIVDIALLPSYRGRGVGTALLEALLAEGAATGRRVSIHVERVNRALRLYQRLGFVAVADRGVHVLMEWHPPPSSIR